MKLNIKIIVAIGILLVLAAVGYGIYINKKASDAVPNITVSKTAPQNKSLQPFVCQDSGSPVLKIGSSQKFGKYYSDSGCRSLYISSNDKPLKSLCDAKCAQIWIPMVYDGYKLTDAKDPVTKMLNIIKRADGSLQYSFGNSPLYYYKLDDKPGDTLGQGIGNVWSVVSANMIASQK